MFGLVIASTVGCDLRRTHLDIRCLEDDDIDKTKLLLYKVGELCVSRLPNRLGGPLKARGIQRQVFAFYSCFAYYIAGI